MVLGPATTVYLLAFIPAVIWGFTPVLDKRGMALGATPLQASLGVVVVDLSLFLLALVITRGFAPFAGVGPFAAGLFLLSGVLGTALGRLTVFDGVDRVGASVNSAVVSARPLFAAVFAFGLLGETLSLATVLGIVVLVSGLVTLSLSKGGDLGGWSSWELGYPLASAAFFALGNVIRRYGLELGGTDVLQAVAINEAGALFAFLGYAALGGSMKFRSTDPRSAGYFAASGSLTAVALLSMFGALALPAGRVAIVESLGATAPLFTTAFAYFLLRDLERVTRGILLGALLVAVGVALVTLGPLLLG